MPRVLWWSQEGWLFFLGEEPLYSFTLQVPPLFILPQPFFPHGAMIRMQGSRAAISNNTPYAHCGQHTLPLKSLQGYLTHKNPSTP